MTATKKAAATGFSAEERAAMRERARELKEQAANADGDAAVAAKIAELPQPDRTLAQRIDALCKAHGLVPKTWYGMPAYARDGKIVCFFQSAHKFKTRYATLGFSDQAHLDEGNVWPTAFALARLSPADETRIAAVIRQAVR